MFAKAMFKGASQAGEYTVGESLRLNNDDTAYLTRTPASAGNRKTWTWSGWIKRGSFSEQFLFGVANAGNNSDYTNIQFFTGRLNFSNWTGAISLYSSAEYRDPSAWYHIVCSVDTTQATASERIRMYINGNRITDWQTANYPSQNAELPINNSVVHQMGARLTAGAIYTFDGYLAEVYFIDGQALDPTDFGGYDTDGYWKPKRYSGTFGTNGFYLPFKVGEGYGARFDGSSDGVRTTNTGTEFAYGTGDFTIEGWINAPDQTNAFICDTRGGFASHPHITTGSVTSGTLRYGNTNTESTTKICDGTWHHFAVTRQSGSVKLWVDGVLENTVTDTGNYGSNYITIGTNSYGYPTNNNLNGYLSNFRVVKGTAVYTSNFTPSTVPLTAITNTQLLTFQDSTFVDNSANALPLTVSGDVFMDEWSPFADSYPDDKSGNGNNWFPSGVSSLDSVEDTPTANYATWNPIVRSANTFANGNLDVTTSASTPAKIVSTIGASSGKYYMEYTHQGNNNWPIGVAADNRERNYLGEADGSTSVSFWCGTTTTQVYINGVSQSFSGSATTWAASDIVGIALDVDNEEVSLYKNGTLVGAAVSFSAYGWTQAFFAAGNYISGNQYISNFGQRPFAYTPPTGFKALNSKNLPKPTILDGGKHFDTALYTGNGTSQTITGLGFQPDIVWLKSRNYSHFHLLMDSVRGNTKFLTTNATSTEDTVDTGTGIVPTSDGFSVQYSGDWNSLNTSGRNVVAWTWNAGGSTVTNTNGTITSSVRANPDAGISIVSYTGNASTNQTIGHGLGQDIDMVIVKNRSSTTVWRVWHAGLSGDTYYLGLNQSFGEYSSSTIFNGHSSTTFTIGNDSSVNANGNSLIAYCFAGVEGFSKFDSYTGNGSTDGPFVYTGFRPAFVMVKQINADGARWNIWDVQRDPYNLTTRGLFPNLSDAEVTAFDVDLVSNGFKLRDAETTLNGSGSTYIYMAFAENPFKKARAR